MTTLNQTAAPQEQGKSPRRVVGVGNVGLQADKISYVLYNPGTDKVSFKQVQGSMAKGFGARQAR